MGILDDVTGAFDHASGSVDESISRQFDDTEGGGTVDELAALADPTRRASDQTEADAALVAQASPVLAGPAGALSLIPQVATGGRNDPADSSDTVTEAAFERAFTGYGEAGTRANDAATTALRDRYLPDWAQPTGDSGPSLPVVEIGIFLGVLSIVAYAVGQLFTFQVGGGS